MDGFQHNQHSVLTHGQDHTQEMVGLPGPQGEQMSQTIGPSNDASQSGIDGGPYGPQDGLTDLAFVNMVNQSQTDGDDLLGPLWQSNYNIYAGPWNPVGLLDSAQEISYPSYRRGPATEPVFRSPALDVAGQDNAASFNPHGYTVHGPSPSRKDSGITTSGHGATPSDVRSEVSSLLGAPVDLTSRRHSGDGNAMLTMRARRMSSKSDRTLPPCEICLREGKGRRIPKNYADQKKHGLTHTRPYTCPVPGCPRQPSFATQNDLERHARGCHGIETRLGTHHYYRCNVPSCPKGNRLWDRRDNFRQHLQRIHKELAPENINECLKSAVYHPTEAELKAYHASKKTSSGRRHRAVSDYGGTVTTMDDLSTLAGPNDLGADSPAINSLQSDFMTGGFGGIDFSGPFLLDSALEPNWLQGIGEINLTNFGDPTQLDLSSLNSSTTPVSVHEGPADSYLSLGNYGLDFAQTVSVPSSNLSLDVGFPDIMGVNQPRFDVHRGFQPDHALQQSPAEMTSSGLPTPPEIFERRDSVNPQHSVNLDGQLKCSYCDKRVARSCDLTKHEKRHTKPFGCTFPKCNKLFGSKNDWKRHETSVHSSPAVWRCDIGGCSTHQPARFFYDKSFLLEHLEREHQVPSQGKDGEAESDRLRIDGTGGDRFWCGFCQAIITAGEDPKSTGFSGAEARLRHIGDHYDHGEDKCNYSCLEMNRGKGYLWRTSPASAALRADQSRSTE